MSLERWPQHRLSPDDLSGWSSHGLAGTLVTVDGVDGSGRATQLDLLEAWLKVEGYGVIRTQWNSSKLVSRTIAEARRQNTLTPLTYSILHATDLAERVESEVLPGLRAGYVVLADRYLATALARDISRGVDQEWIFNLFAFVARPDVAVYLRIDPDTSMERILGIGGEASSEEANESAAIRGALRSFRQFQEQVVQEYEGLVARFGMQVIDATAPIREQQVALRHVVRAALDKRLNEGEAT